MDVLDKLWVVDLVEVKTSLGVRTTKAVKKVGCSNMKQLLETDKLLVDDFDIINELSTFIVQDQSISSRKVVMMIYLCV